MAFDRNSAADLLALKTEVNTDPIGMGYDPAGPTAQLLKLLNEPALNIGGEQTNAPLTARELWVICAKHPDDLTPHGQFSAGDQFVIAQLFEASTGSDDDLSWARDLLIGLFPAQDAIVAEINALQRAISRAEVLFGVNTSISRDDWIAARDS